MANKNRVKVKIRGYSFTIVGYESEEHILGIAEEVDNRIKKIASSNAKLNQFEAVVLAAINLLEELEKEKERSNRIIEGLKEDANLEKLANYEEMVDKLAVAEKKIENYESNIAKYKENDVFVTQKLSEEVKKHREVYNKLKRLEDSVTGQTDEFDKLKSDKERLSKQNFDLETEVVQLKKEIDILRKENKLDEEQE